MFTNVHTHILTHKCIPGMSPKPYIWYSSELRLRSCPSSMTSKNLLNLEHNNCHQHAYIHTYISTYVLTYVHTYIHTCMYIRAWYSAIYEISLINTQSFLTIISHRWTIIWKRIPSIVNKDIITVILSKTNQHIGFTLCVYMFINKNTHAGLHCIANLSFTHTYSKPWRLLVTYKYTQI